MTVSRLSCRFGGSEKTRVGEHAPTCCTGAVVGSSCGGRLRGGPGGGVGSVPPRLYARGGAGDAVAADLRGGGARAPQRGRAAVLGHARLAIVDGARLEGPAELPGGAVVLAGRRGDAAALPHLGEALDVLGREHRLLQPAQ